MRHATGMDSKKRTHLGTVEDLQERGAAAFIFGRDREPRFNYGLVRSQR
jgi:hypothetical protein